MKSIELKELIREMILTELDVNKSIERKIDEFGDLSDEMDRLKKELNGIKKRYSQIEGELRPILEELDRFGEKSLQTERYLVSIKRMGYDRENLKYKEAFEQSLEKVNKQTRMVLEELLQSTKTVSRVVSSVGVQPVSENFFTDLVRKVKSLFGRVVSKLKRTTRDMNELQRLSKLMSN